MSNGVLKNTALRLLQTNDTDANIVNINGTECQVFIKIPKIRSAYFFQKPEISVFYLTGKYPRNVFKQLLRRYFLLYTLSNYVGISIRSNELDVLDELETFCEQAHLYKRKGNL